MFLERVAGCGTEEKKRPRQSHEHAAPGPEKRYEAAVRNQEAVRAAKDAEAKERFIEQNMRFINGSLRRLTNRPVHESDDEWSVGLLAFSEAVDTYRVERGQFSAFAYTVMARRLADHYRRTARRAREIDVPPHVFTSDADEETLGVAYAIHTAVQPLAEREALQEELVAANGLLKGFGFSFFDLTSCSPQTDKTRRACAAAVACILKNPVLAQAMRHKHRLPARRVQEITGIPLKLLDRHRKYIIAVAILMQEDYPHLQEYLHLVREEMRV